MSENNQAISVYYSLSNGVSRINMLNCSSTSKWLSRQCLFNQIDLLTVICKALISWLRLDGNWKFQKFIVLLEWEILCQYSCCPRVRQILTNCWPLFHKNLNPRCFYFIIGLVLIVLFFLFVLFLLLLMTMLLFKVTCWNIPDAPVSLFNLIFGNLNEFLVRSLFVKIWCQDQSWSAFQQVSNHLI